VPFVALGLASVAARLAEGSTRTRVVPMTRA
jgi:hypothetical protein